ncbi:LysM peptidoglycan-binding domain-containing protein [Saccharibacillus sp. CPCC 101409]|uniref:LysM peptidoglycan-binding domain-containing protein n=1 Tax=Saccharibacillus sp. CPCC 101409 TaxID=3058041 RepID=UPI00267331D2|nr:LysM peptidoglycan-binding domain-containing protein [Saccharibacillus sp. CPCC 101409]MDO3412831.1 LysM peptidoglycan-binding domain-containing protein [Saccharibacillus sp. CPCC 101409]
MPKYTTYKSIYEAGQEQSAAAVQPSLHSGRFPRYRLTRSGAVRLRLLLVVMIGLFAGSGVVHALQSGSAQAEVHRVVVSEGDTLWSIAERNKPSDADTRIFIVGIQQKNNLTGSEIYAGDELILPNF